MDDLPSIKRPLSATQLAIREAMKNALPLAIQKPRPTDGQDFVIFDGKPKNGCQSLMDRFLKHKKSTAIDTETSATRAVAVTKSGHRLTSGHKWSQLKTIMTQEIETKRLETEKEREVNDRLENEDMDDDEEVDPLEEEELAYDNKDDDNDEPKEDASDGDKSEANSDEEEVDEDVGSDAEEDESVKGGNPFIDDEADDEDIDDNSDEEVVEKPEKPEDNDSVDNNGPDNEESVAIINDEVKADVDDSQPKTQSSIAADNAVEEECGENGALNDSFLNTSVTSLDESFERRCATQKIALSPFITQKPKQRMSDPNLIQLIPKFDATVEEFDSQMLLGLCSGGFTQSIDSNVKDMEEVKSQDSEQIGDSDGEEVDDKEVLSDARKVKKVFNIESDDESDAEEVNIKMNKPLKSDIKSEISSLKSFNESDGEELVLTDDEVGDEEAEEADNDESNDDNEGDEEEDGEEVVTEKDVRKIGRSFFEDEAELSGSDASSDEEEENDEDYDIDLIGEEENLPSEAELRNQIERIHNKKVLDEDKRQLMVLKEMMFADGDLHDDNDVRQKKFRWNFGDGDEAFVNDYVNEDSEGDYVDSDDEKTNAMTSPGLKMSLKMSATDTKESDSKIDTNFEKLKSKFSLNLKAIGDSSKDNSNNPFEQKKSIRLESFVVRDERLKTLCEPKRSHPIANNSHSFKSNKKFKNSKNSAPKKSIFDLFQQN